MILRESKKREKGRRRMNESGFEWGKEGVFIGVGAYRRFRGA